MEIPGEVPRATSRLVAGRAGEASEPKPKFRGWDVCLITVKEFLMQRLFFMNRRSLHKIFASRQKSRYKDVLALGLKC